MLIKEAVHYYSIIRDKFKNSYLAEDANQIIIGIDCDYIDSHEYSYKTLELFYNNQNFKYLCRYCGLKSQKGSIILEKMCNKVNTFESSLDEIEFF